MGKNTINKEPDCRITKAIFILFCMPGILLATAGIVFARTTAEFYTLEHVITCAQNHSPEAMKSRTLKENKYWRWKFYKSHYKPQLVVNSTLPSYQNSNIAILQDDGSLAHRNIRQSQANISLSLEQNIGLTGGKLFLNSDLSRIDNINQDFYSYSGAPFFIGIEQPLFMYNHLKWQKRIEPLKYKESLKEYVENAEKIAYTTTLKYFNLLIARTSYEMTQKNLKNAETIYQLGREKYAMGKISQNELLQLKFGLISAQKSISRALLSQGTAQLELNSYTGLQNTNIYAFSVPENITFFSIDDSLAIFQALANSRRSVEFKREILEAKQEAERTKKESGLNATLYMSYGTTNIASHLFSIYRDPQTLQTINFGVSVPILDWGRAKANYKTAQANLKLVEYTVQQDKIYFRQETITEIEYFRTLKNLIECCCEADTTAAERYEIARKRYIAGDISLTEYNIALEEKDRAKLDYIIALADYWKTYYTIRILTLYDFENHQSLAMEDE
ncbi:TolC family protein [candidate division KSB1 bacterium]|nr:TolC family protein [candidate division KSB1 bacterium]